MTAEQLTDIHDLSFAARLDITTFKFDYWTENRYIKSQNNRVRCNFRRKAIFVASASFKWNAKTAENIMCFQRGPLDMTEEIGNNELVVRSIQNIA